MIINHKKPRKKRQKKEPLLRVLQEILDESAKKTASHLANDSCMKGGKGAKLRGILERERRVYLDEADQW
jgi:hypothetical protein